MHGLIVSLILIQLVLPSAVLAAPPLSPPAIPIVKPLTTPPTQENPVDATFADVAVTPPLDDRPAPEAALPVALFVSLTSDRTLLHPGEKATLTVNAWRATEEKLDGALLTLELPPELKAAQGKVELQWRLPELEKIAIFSQTVAVQLVGGAFPFETAVVRAVLHTPATEQFSENRAEVVFGLDSRAPEPPASPVAKAVLREKGLVLQGRYGDVTVLVEAGSAATETTFTYTDGYRLGEAQPAAPVSAPLTVTQSVTAPPVLTTTGMITTHPALTTTALPTTPAALTATTAISAAAGLSSTNNLLYLPVVSGEGDESQTAQQTPTASEASSAVPATPAPSAAELPVDNGVSFVRRWQLDAALGDEQITKFATRIGLVIDAGWLLAQKFDPERLTLYTREDPKQGWEEVPDVHYDAQQRAFIARTGHFSEYGLGLSQNVVGENLPDVSSFGTDLFTGAATINYPIELPPGLGGLAPQLSLNYSSATVDSQRWDNNKNQSDGYRVQAGLPGIGWNLGGLGYIAWTSQGIDVGNGNDDHYSFVFNGTSDEFLYSDTQTESFAKISKNLTDQIDPTDFRVKVTGTGSWTVTTRDGTQHIFGGAPVHYSNSSTTSNQGIVLHDIGAFDTYRWVNKWYLSKSIDGNGNYVEYNYLSDKRETNCSTNNKYRGVGGWYYRAVRPASILWGANQTTGAPHRMQVLFTYENRTDTGIWQRDDACTQSMYSNERLKKITVLVHSENVWKPLREYELNYVYTTGTTGASHSWLSTIAHYGFASNGTRTAAPLQTYSFAYTIGAVHSEVYLQEANNGWGGKVVYSYNAPATWRCEIDNTTNCDQVAYRRQVSGKMLYDGTVVGGGNWTYNAYSYAEGLYRRYKNDPVEFLGYPFAWSLIYARNSYNEAKMTEQWFYRDNGNTTRESIANNPDPRLGRLDYERVLQPISASCPVAQQVNYPGGFQRCKMAETDATYTALTGSGISWTPTSSYTTHPRWVRQDSVVNWVDGAAVAQVFTYAAAQQNNTQYGNVTKVEERDGSTGGALLRRTETEYFPNTTAHVVSLPARVRIYDTASTCAAERRYVYGAYYSGSTYVTNVNGTYQTTPTNARLVKSQVALSACSATVSIADTDSGWAITRYAYDAYGNQTTENRLGSNNLVTTTDFDSTYHRFPTRRYRTDGPTTYDETAFYYGVNPASGDPALSDTRAHWGALAEWCGVNEVCSRYAYDDYGRVNRQWDGELTTDGWSGTNGNLDTNAAVIWGYTMYGTNGWTRNVVTEWHAPHCYGNFSRKVYDGLGQLIQVQGPQQDWTTNVVLGNSCNLPNNGKEVDVSYEYDALGNQSRAGVPVAQTVSSVNRAANWAAGYTATVYDVLRRPKSTTAPNGEVQQYNYVGRAWSIVGVGRNGDSNKHLTWQENDALGNLSKVRTYNLTNNNWAVDGEVALAHDVVGNLKTVNHPNSIANTTMSYDLGGRKISMTDPDLGTWSYTYNRQGQLTSQTDARGKTTCLYYDGLERLMGKHLPSTTACPAPGGYNVTYLYDESHGVTLDGTVNRSRGQLTRVFDINYTKWFYYNDKGLLRKEKISISGAPQDYTTSYGYDAYQRPSTVTYPDNEVVTTAYNSMGLQAKLSSNSNSGIDLVDGTQAVGTVATGGLTDAVMYDEAGRLRNLRFPQDGNLWQSYGYYPWTGTDAYGLSNSDSNGRLRLVYVGTNPYYGDKYGSHYSYDSYGNTTVFKEWVDNVTVTDATFGYDAQNRLLTGYGRSYGYDSAGRMTNYESAAQSFHTYRPHAMAPNWSQWAVDLNGNFTSRVQNGVVQTLTWDHQNRLVSVTGTGVNESYLYDADGQRIKKTSNGSAIYYPNQYYEQYGGTNIDKYYYFNGQPIALRRNGGLYYLHQDQIGNMALVTSGGAKVDTQGFYAYGRLRQGIIGVERSFTGQQKDFGTGLIYFNARYYDPELGTFISPDTIVPDPTNLFDYNRYMFVRGNPLKYNDPTGHCASASAIDVVCWVALAEAAATASATLVAGGGGAVAIGVGVYGYQNTTFDLPDYDHSYDIPGTDLQASHPVNGSSTVSSGVPVIQTQNEGFTLVDPPSLDELIVTSDSTPVKYGPFTRIEAAETARKIEESGLLWGEAMRNTFASDIPRVKAYDRQLRDSELGIEFYTDVAPDAGSPPGRAYWSGPRAGVTVEDGKATICCTVTKNTHR